MKVPVPPPAWQDVMNAALQRRGPEILTRAPSENRYWSWDELRYHTPPQGWMHEEWWVAIKLRRLAGRRELPFSDTHGRHFWFSLTDEVLELADEISRRTAGRLLGGDRPVTGTDRDRFIVSSLIEEAISSSQLEGASTTRLVAKQMLESGRAATTHSERMIVNNYRAMQRMRHLAERDLTPALVLELHRIVTEGTLENEADAGRLQSNPDPDDRVSIRDEDDNLLHRPPPVTELPGRLDLLCRFANGETASPWMPPVLRALTLHFMMGYDHYFVDGNGRTARSVFYWSMLHEGCWLAQFLTISSILHQAPSRYARSFLLTEQDEGDLTYFFLYHLRVIVRALDNLDEYLERKARETRRAADVARGLGVELNDRQLAIIDALHDAAGTLDQVTVVWAQQKFDVSHETARQDLQGLTDARLLHRRRSGHAYAWTETDRLRGAW